MSENKKNYDELKKVSTYLLSFLCGTAASGILLALFSLAMYILGLPPEIAGALSFIAFAAGCILSGFVCGSIKRRRGLRCGIVCAAAMLCVPLTVSLISGSFTGLSLVPKLIGAVTGACTGAVLGVNRK